MVFMMGVSRSIGVIAGGVRGVRFPRSLGIGYWVGFHLSRSQVFLEVLSFFAFGWARSSEVLSVTSSRILLEFLLFSLCVSWAMGFNVPRRFKTDFREGTQAAPRKQGAAASA